ncbi:uncharacterized protein [Nicotiana tomentosiformis]|uniref:uncharacterized protein n=1 Tax=Nicotiana tomentosiformis TaxID=4098 RepID=UPI00388CE644
MTSPDIQKDIVNSCSEEMAKAIIEDLNGNFFGIFVDESKDVFHKEQMALILRYVNKEGELIERFLGLVHVKDTTAYALQKIINSLLLQHSLSLSLIRGQGYDGASNMQGEINGLKALILKDNPPAYCVHCFAHQLQLTLVAVAKKHHDINNFFDILANVLNVVGESYKRREILKDDQAEKLDKLLVLGEVHTGSGLNQELGFQRPGDTRWGSHFKTLRNFISLFSSIVHVLGVLANEGSNYQEKALAKCLVEDIRSYEFVYILHLMLKIMAITYDLNMALQIKDQDIVNTMKLVHFTKSFELDNYIDYVREMDNAFSNLKGLGDLSKTLVKTNIHKTWRLVYLLVKLSLILPVAIATVERAFSSMKFIKNDLRDRIGDDFLNDCLVCYIEDGVFESVPNDAIIDRFQNITSRRVQLK